MEKEKMYVVFRQRGRPTYTVGLFRVLKNKVISVRYFRQSRWKLRFYNNFLQTFRDNLSVPSYWPRRFGTTYRFQLSDVGKKLPLLSA